MILEKVNFMIIGVQKCGTTSLAYILNQHPDINFCSQKEPSFFSKVDDWEKKIDKYHGLYSKNKSGLKGEASTSYSWYYEYPKTPCRLKNYNPDLKFVYIMRDPIDRIRSHYQHNFLKGRTKKSLNEEVVSNPTYINHSRYAVQIRPYIKLFGLNRIHFMTLEDFIRNEKLQLKKLCEFLKIDYQPLSKVDTSPKNQSKTNLKVNFVRTLVSPFLSLFNDDFKIKIKEKIYNTSTMNHEIDVDFRNYLMDHVIDDLIAIENISGLDLSEWKK